MKFPYLIIGEDYSVTGINTLAEATEAAEWALVIDVEKGVELAGPSGEDIPIKQYQPFAD